MNSKLTQTINSFSMLQLASAGSYWLGHDASLATTVPGIRQINNSANFMGTVCGNEYKSIEVFEGQDSQKYNFLINSKNLRPKNSEVLLFVVSEYRQREPRDNTLKTLDWRGSGVEIAGGNGKSKMDSSGTTTTIFKRIVVGD